jgi:uncharacterized membrane protein
VSHVNCPLIRNSFVASYIQPVHIGLCGLVAYQQIYTPFHMPEL